MWLAGESPRNVGSVRWENHRTKSAMFQQGRFDCIHIYIYTYICTVGYCEYSPIRCHRYFGKCNSKPSPKSHWIFHQPKNGISFFVGLLSFYEFAGHEFLRYSLQSPHTVLLWWICWRNDGFEPHPGNHGARHQLVHRRHQHGLRKLDATGSQMAAFNGKSHSKIK